MTHDERFAIDPADEAEIARLEGLLSPLRYEGEMPVLGVQDAGLPRRRWPLLAAAALLLAAVGAGFLLLRGRGPEVDWPPALEGWGYERGLGRGSPSEHGVLAVGGWLETDGLTHARLEVADIGALDVHPGSRLRLLRTAADEHRLRLERGRVHASVLAPPRLFLIETPAALAVDLGCSYDLVVDERGDGWLDVRTGWVALEREGIESRVPAGARCFMRRDRGPGTPHWREAPDALAAALSRLDFERDDAALESVLALARPDDGLTLWHLLPRTEGARRAATYDRLAALVEIPTEVSAAEERRRTLALEPAGLEAWWSQVSRRW
jgi:hypothetical protein